MTGAYAALDAKVTAFIAGVLREQAQVVDGNAIALRNMDDGEELADLHAEVARKLLLLAGLVDAGLLGLVDFNTTQAEATAKLLADVELLTAVAELDPAPVVVRSVGFDAYGTRVIANAVARIAATYPDDDGLAEDSADNVADIRDANIVRLIAPGGAE